MGPRPAPASARGPYLFLLTPTPHSLSHFRKMSHRLVLSILSIPCGKQRWPVALPSGRKMWCMGTPLPRSVDQDSPLPCGTAGARTGETTTMRREPGLTCALRAQGDPSFVEVYDSHLINLLQYAPSILLLMASTPPKSSTASPQGLLAGLRSGPMATQVHHPAGFNQRCSQALALMVSLCN